MQSLWDTQVQYSVTVGHTSTVFSHCGTHTYSISHCRTYSYNTHAVTVGQPGTVLLQSLCDTQVKYSVSVGHTGTVLSHCGTHRYSTQSL